MKKSYTIIHLSDLHYSFPELGVEDLQNKRILGVANEIFFYLNQFLPTRMYMPVTIGKKRIL